MRTGALITIVLVSFLLTNCSTSDRSSRPHRSARCAFVAVTNFSAFRALAGSKLGENVLISPELAAPSPWDELVVSWNAIAPLGTDIKIEARAIYPDRTTEFYTMGWWAEDTAQGRRESVTDQKDEDGDVQTDTLILKRPAERLQLRITLSGFDERVQPRLKLLGLSFLNTSAKAELRPPNKAAWGKTLAVPERSQLSYPGGRDWCSPASVSMVLAYWAAVLKRPKLNVDVPEVAAAVFDKNWPGTGNWPFNTAFAGRFSGLRAYVTRLGDLSELETLVAAGIPPIASVSFDSLRGRAEDPGTGHLIVCVGFTEQGDAVINDPWARPETKDRIRQVIPRRNLEKAWARSRQTIYLIYPEEWPLPASGLGRW